MFIVECIKCGDFDARRNTKDFLKIFLTDFSSSLYKTAIETQNSNKRNKVIQLPQQEDVNKLSSYLLKQITRLYEALSKKFSVDCWGKLSKYILCYIQLFNRKRAGEIERLLINDFNSYQSLDKEKPSVLYNSLTNSERLLADHFVKIDIRGKLGRTVPVLIKKDHIPVIQYLLSKRQLAGVFENNPYVFGSPNSTNSYFRDYVAMKTCALECGALEPNKLRGTSLRKHLATTAQVLNLGENEMGRLANFMGHDLAIQHYQLPSTAMDVSQTSKLLLIMEEANVEKYRGHALREIDEHPCTPNPWTSTFSCPSTSYNIAKAQPAIEDNSNTSSDDYIPSSDSDDSDMSPNITPKPKRLCKF